LSGVGAPMRAPAVGAPTRPQGAHPAPPAPPPPPPQVDPDLSPEEREERKAAEQQKAAEAKRNTLIEIRTRDLAADQLAQRASEWIPKTNANRQVVHLLWDQIKHDTRLATWVAGKMGWPIPTEEIPDYMDKSKVRIHKKPHYAIDAMNSEQVPAALLLIAACKALCVDEYRSNSDTTSVAALGVDIPGCRKQATADVDAKAAKKAKGKK
ncbi:MAG: hypothetical protein ACOYON_16280, partial [Fimbriimonas sp.]